MIEHPLYKKVAQTFRARFLRDPEVMVRAPGRVNLIGEHTDYNDGFVLPIAVDRAAWVASASCREPQATLRAIDMKNDEVVFPVNQVPTSSGGWGDYPAGIVWAFLNRGLRPFGLEAVLSSDVPVGAGMSSSAAVEVAFALTWSVFSGFGLALEELALLAQRAENEYVGVSCGIMDQMISACGKAGHAMLLDTRSLERSYIPMPEGITVIVADSQVRRSLSGSEYNARRSQCEEAVRLLRTAGLPEIRALRDVTPVELARYGAALPEVILRRTRHVVSENARVHQVVAALQEGDLESVGALLLEGHRSLRDDYEISIPEIDALVAAAMEVPGCYGARLTGGGFGGCIIALVDTGVVTEVEAHLKQTYRTQFGKEPGVYAVHPADGASYELL